MVRTRNVREINKTMAVVLLADSILRLSLLPEGALDTAVLLAATEVIEAAWSRDLDRRKSHTMRIVKGKVVSNQNISHG